MTNEPREPKVYTREEVLAIANAWGDINYWFGKLEGYSQAGYEPKGNLDFHLDRPNLVSILRNIPGDISRELEKRGYDEEIVQKLSKMVDTFDLRIPNEEFDER